MPVDQRSLMEHRRLGKRFENDWSKDELKDIYRDIATAVTIPVNIAIKAKHRVLDLERVERLLRDASLIALQDCGCRSLRRNCAAPLDVCISLNADAEQALKNGRYRPRKVTLEEALDALRRSHEAGLVHMAYTFEGSEGPNLICSCCSCCCHTLSGLIRFGLARHILTSDRIAETDYASCINCGKCIERCQFEARRMIDGRMIYDSGRCFGCGLCVSTCPSDAIKLVKRA